MQMRILGLASSVLLACAVATPAQIQINEMLINPPGTDNGFEYFEISSAAPSTSLAGLTFLSIEADPGVGAGTIDQALSLGAFSTGINGLFLWRDSTAAMVPAADPATTVHVADFAPDFENGGNCFFIVSGFTGSVDQDLETTGDNLFETTPWASLVDAICWSVDIPNPISPDFATPLGGVGFPQVEFGPDAFARFGGQAYAFDVLGTNPGPFDNDPLEIMAAPGPVPTGFSIRLTPGGANVPEPASLALLGLGSLVAVRRRK